jgi:hypothetical protein
MVHLRRHRWWVGLCVGLLLGLIFGGLWPDSPLHATATDRVQSFAIATGFVDDESEAIYVLDFLTGTLRAAVVSNRLPGGFQARYEANINADLTGTVTAMNAAVPAAGKRGRGAVMGPEVQLPQTPTYLMVTGMADLKRGSASRERPSRALVYVYETSTGVLLVYALPWSVEAHAANQPSGGQLILWARDQFSTAIKRPEP